MNSKLFSFLEIKMQKINTSISRKQSIEKVYS